MKDLDSAMNSLDAWESKERGETAVKRGEDKELIGNVDEFYDRINVIAIELTGSLKVGDIIEIGNDEEAIRQKVSSMQINRQDIQEAAAGDSVGVKVNYAVPVGSSVYRIGPKLDRI